MGVGIVSWSLHVLLVGLQLIAVCNGASDHSSHNKLTYFMHPKDLKKGAKMPTLSFKELMRPTTRFLPKNEADSIPFSSRHLPEIHRIFAGSPNARYIDETIKTCEIPPLKGETKTCATSFESMLDFVERVFEIDPDSGDSPTLLTTTTRFDHPEIVQNYTIWESPVEIPTKRIVGCHTQVYPYTVAYCHSSDGLNKAYRLLLRGDLNGDLIDMVVACHFDTWEWSPTINAFKALGTRPGDPACHIFPFHGNFLWVYTDRPQTATT